MTDEPRHVALERRLAAEGWERRGHRWMPSGLGEKIMLLWEKRNDRPGSRGWLQAHVPYHAGPSYDAECDQVLVDIASARGETWASTLRERDELRALVAELDELVATLNPLDDVDPEARYPAEVHRWNDFARQAIQRHRARQEGQDDG